MRRAVFGMRNDSQKQNVTPRFKLDICDIRAAALAWNSGRKAPLPMFRDYVVRIANDNGYRVTGSVVNEQFVEVRLSTAEIIWFSGEELR